MQRYKPNEPPTERAGEANIRGPDSTAMRIASLAGTWTLVPPASGEECARALRRAGLEVEPGGADHLLVRRCGIDLVQVPLVPRLRPELLVAILRAVGMTPAAFTALLDE